MPNEQLKPCPACGGQAQSDAGHDGSHVVYWVECCGCEMTGPMLRTDMDSAIAAWDQLPRALTWTTEPPKVAGWYWMRTNSKIDHVANAEKENCGGVYEIMPVKIIDGMPCYDMKFEDSPIVIDTEIFEWAGPIDAPGD